MFKKRIKIKKKFENFVPKYFVYFFFFEKLKKKVFEKKIKVFSNTAFYFFLCHFQQLVIFNF